MTRTKEFSPARTMHPDLATGRWRRFTLVEQLSHVGSEVHRAIRAWQAKRPERFDGSFIRALELFDLTAEDPRWKGPNRREILRLREEFCQLFFPPRETLPLQGDSPPDTTPESLAGARSLQRYFLQLAILARDPSDGG